MAGYALSYLGKTNDGYSVHDRPNSHIHTENGITTDLIKSALKRINTCGAPFIKCEISFAHTIGYTHCVETTPQDEIVMVYRKGRAGETPMVKNRLPEPSNILTVIIKKTGKHYTLITAFIGGGSLKEPWDKSIRTSEEYLRCTEYWNTHALIYNPDLVDLDRN